MTSSTIRPIVLIVGTRPEGIKMVPLYKSLKKAELPTLLCSTMQHDGLLSQVFDLFEIKPDFNLKIMRQGQDLFYLTQSILQKTKEIFTKVKPSMVIVQGDTTSTMAAALSAFYLSIPICHIEAGLRTYDINHPFPEEANRRMISIIAKYHFAPTAHAAAQLLAQGIDRKNVFCTGNTIVDSLRLIKEKIDLKKIIIKNNIKKLIDEKIKNKKKIIILTTHRRESFNGGITQILKSVKKYLMNNKDTFCIYPFHPNPNVISAIEKTELDKINNIYLSEPVSYNEMIYLLSNCNLVLTDSGGIQEEAISLSKPVLILREKTERIEGVWSGLAKIVGNNENKIIEAIKKYITFSSKNKQNIYGDGYAADKITEIIKTEFENNKLIYIPAKKSSTDKNLLSHLTLINKNRELNMEKVCVLGLGYIGLPTAIVLAENQFNVTGFDIDEEKVKKINNGNPTIKEPEIFEKLQLVLQSGTFRASTKCTNANYFIIAVPTPFKENKKSDLSYVYKAATFISKVLQKGNTILLESTIPVGTTEKVAHFIEEKTKLKAGEDFFVAHCPERVLPGKIFNELIENDRIIGGINKTSTYKSALLYTKFVNGNIHLTNSKTSEIVKLIENSSRDAQIAFAHQVASMALSEDLDPYEIIELANKHPRVNILSPSCGVGGHCIAVDPWFLVESFPNCSELIKTVRTTNDNRPKEIVQIIEKHIQKWKTNNNKKCTILLLGLTYKPDVDDLRESPAILIAEKLTNNKNIHLLIAEPLINKEKLANIFGSQLTSVDKGVQNADIIIFLVAHKRFRAIDKKLFKNKTILDFCGITHIPKIDYLEKKNNKTYATNGILDFFIANSNKQLHDQNNKGHDL